MSQKLTANQVALNLQEVKKGNEAEIRSLEEKLAELRQQQTVTNDKLAAFNDCRGGIYDSWYGEVGHRADGGDAYFQAWCWCQELMRAERGQDGCPEWKTI